MTITGGPYSPLRLLVILYLFFDRAPICKPVVLLNLPANCSLSVNHSLLNYDYFKLAKCCLGLLFGSTFWQSMTPELLQTFRSSLQLLPRKKRTGIISVY